MNRTTTIAALLWAAACAAQAGSLQLAVTDKDGKPAADVVVLVETTQKAAPAIPGAPVVIAQEGLRFVPFLSVVPVGATLRFVNRDGYDHHVRSVPSGPLGAMPPVKEFELRLDAAAEAPAAPRDEYQSGPAPRKRPKSGMVQADVKVDQPGPIGLGCHLHSSMRGQVYVAATPFFAKTDANGQARIDDLPEGAAELRLWHPDQLQDQPMQKLQIGAAPLPAAAQLNFVPRRRRS